MSFGELAPLLSLGRKFRALGRADMIELLRVMPMSIQDLLDDWFESPILKAAVAAGGVRDIRQGPRSGGTSFVLLHNLVGAPAGLARPWWRDGPDAFTGAVADVARANNVAVRTGAHVARILVRDDVVTGVVLANGDEISAPVVVSTADPARTLLGMVDPVWLDPEFLHAVRNIKFRGCTALVRFALDRLPDVSGLEDSSAALSGTMSLTPSLDALERAYDAAKYGRRFRRAARRDHGADDCAGRRSLPPASMCSLPACSTRPISCVTARCGTTRVRASSASRSHGRSIGSCRDLRTLRCTGRSSRRPISRRASASRRAR